MQLTKKPEPLHCSNSAAFCRPFDLISIIYANIQNPFCNFVGQYHSYRVATKSDLT